MKYEGSDVSIVIEKATSENAQQLIAELDADLRTRYPESSIHGIEVDQVEGNNGVFVVAYSGGVPVGCGAFRRLEQGVVEVKRMFVRHEARRRGIARQILAKLESLAQEKGCFVLRLETGTQQPESLRFYESMGYQRIPCFGEYINDPFSVCYEKNLSP